MERTEEPYNWRPFLKGTVTEPNDEDTFGLKAYFKGMLYSHAISNQPAPSPSLPAAANTTGPATNSIASIQPENTMECMINYKTFARRPIQMTATVPILSHRSWDDPLCCSAPVPNSTGGDLCRLDDAHLTNVPAENMKCGNCPKRLTQTIETASLERRETSLEERLQSEPVIAPSTNFARQELPQSILTTHKISSDTDVHQVKRDILSSVVQMQYTVKIPRDNGRVWTTLHINAPAGLTAKLPTNQLQTVVGCLTEFAWFECGDPSIQSNSRTLLRTLARLVSGLLSRLPKCRMRGYLAVLSYIDRHVVLRSGKRAQVLGISRNKVLVKKAGRMGWVEGSDIVRAMQSHPKAVERGDNKLGCTVVRLPDPSDTRTDGTVADPVQGELVTMLSGKTSTKAIRSKSNGVISEPSGADLESSSESVATWRTHDAYQAERRDGKYCCSWAGCTKEPMELKCHYQKHIDSHVKPFRCNQKGCSGTGFSSNDCLRRHVRQQHGSAAHFCPVSGCERETRGFPREYNLRGHIQRVHRLVET